MNPERFARWVFRGAGVYGLLVLAPQYFIEQRIGLDNPPAITHPEYFYGFIGVGLAFQILFLAIGSNPLRMRAAIPAGILEKVSFGAASWILYVQHRIAGPVVFFSSIDLILAALFLTAYLKMGNAVKSDTGKEVL
jgi:hypothetical protein